MDSEHGSQDLDLAQAELVRLKAAREDIIAQRPRREQAYVDARGWLEIALRQRTAGLDVSEHDLQLLTQRLQDCRKDLRDHSELVADADRVVAAAAQRVRDALHRL